MTIIPRNYPITLDTCGHIVERDNFLSLKLKKNCSAVQVTKYMLKV